MTIIIEFFDNFLELTNAMSIYILVGLLIAGILKQLIPDDFISSQLGNSSVMSVIKSTILGIPLPVCSCSVIPLAKSLEKEGASRGAVQSFLISSPITGVDSMMATYSFFGIFFTLYRVVTSVIMAIIAGILQNLFGGSENNKNIDNKTEEKEEESCCCSGDKKVKEKFSMKKVFSYAYMTLFGDIAKALFWGLVIGAAFTTFLPKELLNQVFEYKVLTYFLILVISLPMYICATSSLPIVASLMMVGMSGGAGFVFLSAGPATNSVTMGVIVQMFGKKSLAIYLGVISVFSILFGMLLDIFLGDIEVTSFMHDMEHSNIFNIISSVLMLLLIAYFLLKPLFSKKEAESCCSSDSEDECENDKPKVESCCSDKKEGSLNSNSLSAPSIKIGTIPTMGVNKNISPSLSGFNIKTTVDNKKEENNPKVEKKSCCSDKE